MKINTSPLKLLTFLTVPIILFIVLSYNGVDNSITEEDRLFITKYLESDPPLKENRTYKEELEFIAKIQDSVLEVAPSTLQH